MSTSGRRPKRDAHLEARKIIKNVVEFFDHQKAADRWVLPLEKATELAAAATGKSVALISTVRAEARSALKNENQSGKLFLYIGDSGNKCEPLVQEQNVVATTTNKITVVPAKKKSRIESTTTALTAIRNAKTLKILKIPATNFGANGKNTIHKLREVTHIPQIMPDEVMTDTVARDDEHTNRYASNFEDEHSFSNNISEHNYHTIKCEPLSPNVFIEETDPLSTEIVKTEALYPLEENPTQDLPVIKLEKNPTTTDDEFDTIAKNFAHKLRKMDQQQMIIAEKIISDIMYNGQMKMLTVESHLALNK